MVLSVGRGEDTLSEEDELSLSLSSLSSEESMSNNPSSKGKGDEALLLLPSLLVLMVWEEKVPVRSNSRMVPSEKQAMRRRPLEDSVNAVPEILMMITIMMIVKLR